MSRNLVTLEWDGSTSLFGSHDQREGMAAFVESREPEFQWGVYQMSHPYPPAVGEVYTHERTFTIADVRQFGEVSGDQQPIHTEPNEDGTLVVQGLLTATLPTKIGGDLEVLASKMKYRFRRPVYTGETITCKWINEEVSERSDRYEISCSIECRNDEEEIVMTGETDGIIWKEDDSW